MSTTINKEEIQKFSKLADEWWDVNGKFKPLHMFNPIRIEYITERIKKHFNLKKNKNNFLEGLHILDIGCGGGLISEPMARLGAKASHRVDKMRMTKYFGLFLIVIGTRFLYEYFKL